MDINIVNIAAICTGLAAIIAGVAGVLLAIRAARNKERKAAAGELDEVTDMLGKERDLRIKSEAKVFRLRLLLAKHGIEDDEPD